MMSPGQSVFGIVVVPFINSDDQDELPLMIEEVDTAPDYYD